MANEYAAPLGRVGQGDLGTQLTCPKGTESGTFRRRGRPSVPFPATGGFLLQKGDLKHCGYDKTEKLGFPELI